MADDALNVQKMNVNPAGKQNKMRPGYYYKDCTATGGKVKVKQPMCFETGPLIGEAKGLRTVCEERFGSESTRGSN